MRSPLGQSAGVSALPSRLATTRQQKWRVKLTIVLVNLLLKLKHNISVAVENILEEWQQY